MITVINAFTAGELDKFGSAVYATEHNAGSADFVYNDINPFYILNSWLAGGSNFYSIQRCGIAFDTSSIGGKTIANAVLSLYGNHRATDDGASNFVVVNGSALADTLLTADYGDLLASTMSFGSISSTAWTVGSYNNISLNANGIAAINKTGKTRFGLRHSFDINSSIPLGNNDFAADGIGSANIPYLTITTSYPTDAMLRVTGITRTFWPGKKIYQMQVNIGGNGAAYIPPVANINFIPAVPALAKSQTQPKGINQAFINAVNQAKVITSPQLSPGIPGVPAPFPNTPGNIGNPPGNSPFVTESNTPFQIAPPELYLDPKTGQLTRKKPK